MAHDESVYPDPFSFKPERFLNEDGTLNDDSRILAYGFGRRRVSFHLEMGVVSYYSMIHRVCVGKSVASSMVSFVTR